MGLTWTLFTDFSFAFRTIVEAGAGVDFAVADFSIRPSVCQQSLCPGLKKGTAFCVLTSLESDYYHGVVSV